MTLAALFKQYVYGLFGGRRAEAREIIFNALDRGVTAPTLLTKVIWVAMEQIEKLYRRNEISSTVEHMATRINRSIADQLQAHLPPQPKTGKRMVITCGGGQMAELGAQITADLFGAQGWSIWFLGSGVASDEILELINDVQADILCIYGAQPRGLPAIRQLIQTIRDIGAHEDMQILDRLSQQAKKLIIDVPGLVNLRSDLEAARPELRFKHILRPRRCWRGISSTGCQSLAVT